MKRSTLGRALVGAILFLTLGGPAPGAVGSCGDESVVADAVQFCVIRKAFECDRTKVRQQGNVVFAGMYPNEPPPVPAMGCGGATTSEVIECNHLACRGGVLAACSGVNWPSDCNPPPTELVTTACTDALANAANLALTTAEITECSINVLCPPPGAALTEALEEADVGAIHESPVQAEGI